jgi:hypothetical protein
VSNKALEKLRVKKLRLRSAKFEPNADIEEVRLQAFAGFLASSPEP